MMREKALNRGHGQTGTNDAILRHPRLTKRRTRLPGLWGAGRAEPDAALTAWVKT